MLKTKLGLFLIVTLLLNTFSVFAEDVTTVQAKNSDISDNLDLEAVATLFGQSKDLEDFEKKLNDPDIKASNLDLNEDGKVDYLRVLSTSEKNTHLVTIQAVIGENQFQDVASIDVEKDSKGETQVQVVGDVYMYGPNYVITPVYTTPPAVYFFFFSAAYVAWHSPYYWGFYPPFFHPWVPFGFGGYHNHVNVNINIHNNHFNHTNIRNSNTAIKLDNKVSRNDFAKNHPDKSFKKRNSGVTNKRALDSNRAKAKTQPAQNKLANKSGDKLGNAKQKLSTDRPVSKDWKPKSELTGAKNKVQNNKISIPNKSKYNAVNSRDHALSGAGNRNLADRNFNRGASSHNFNRGGGSFGGGGFGGGRLGGGGLRAR
jgi:uncharacterized membrane protein YgcG